MAKSLADLIRDRIDAGAAVERLKVFEERARADYSTAMKDRCDAEMALTVANEALVAALPNS